MKQQIKLKANEGIIFNLRSLFDSYGYSQYRMSKFEEYDLYSKNKDFLVSDGVITFTDTNGKLMALKPDVTLSIVKNTQDGEGVQKLYYNENVYRVSKSTKSFKEIMQVGLECIGEVDGFCVFEVLSLAAKSLSLISENSVLDVSSLDILMQVMDYAEIPNGEKADMFRCIGEKNLHELTAKCVELGVPDGKTELLKALVSLHGAPETVLPKLKELLDGVVCADVLAQFADTVSNVNGCAVNIDFSVIDDIRYYNGIVFKGFIEGVPNSVLSGGQYDVLMKKMKRRNGAVGFAVYLDMLEQFNIEKEKFDVDEVLVYDNKPCLDLIGKYTEKLRSEGSSVLVTKKAPQNIRYKRLSVIENGEVKTVENNA